MPSLSLLINLMRPCWIKVYYFILYYSIFSDPLDLNLLFAYETQSHHASKLGLDRCRLSRLCRLFRLCVCVLGHTRICINQLCVQMWLSLPSSLSHAYALVTCSMSQEHPVIPARVPKTPPTALAPLPHTHTQRPCRQSNCHQAVRGLAADLIWLPAPRLERPALCLLCPPARQAANPNWRSLPMLSSPPARHCTATANESESRAEIEG